MASDVLLPARRPFFHWPAAFAIACLVGTLATDFAYWRTADWFWADFSDWLLVSGVILGAFALVVALVEFLVIRPARVVPPRWPVVIGGILALFVAFLDTLIHTRDAWTSVVPWGVFLSVVAVVILLGAGVLARFPPRGRPVLSGVAAVVVLMLAFMLALGLNHSNAAFDVMNQVGPNPELPRIRQYLFPPMHLARVVGWKEGEMPTIAPGLRIEPLAQDLEHPRSLTVLPNGDILVIESRSPGVQPIHRPKDIAMNVIERWVTSGGKTGPSNRITLLRLNGDGRPGARTVFLDHLSSPFGATLVGNDFYVANTDSIMRYPYAEGDTQITAPGAALLPLPGGPIDHHWTKSLVASRDGSLLYVGVGSNSNIVENGFEAERNRAAIWEVERATGRWRIFARRAAQSQWPFLRTGDGRAVDSGQ